MPVQSAHSIAQEYFLLIRQIIVGTYGQYAKRSDPNGVQRILATLNNTALPNMEDKIHAVRDICLEKIGRNVLQKIAKDQDAAKMYHRLHVLCEQYDKDIIELRMASDEKRAPLPPGSMPPEAPSIGLAPEIMFSPPPAAALVAEATLLNPFMSAGDEKRAGLSTESKSPGSLPTPSSAAVSKAEVKLSPPPPAALPTEEVTLSSPVPAEEVRLPPPSAAAPVSAVTLPPSPVVAPISEVTLSPRPLTPLVDSASMDLDIPEQFRLLRVDPLAPDVNWRTEPNIPQVLATTAATMVITHSFPLPPADWTAAILPTPLRVDLTSTMPAASIPIAPLRVDLTSTMPAAPIPIEPPRVDLTSTTPAAPIPIAPPRVDLTSTTPAAPIPIAPPRVDLTSTTPATPSYLETGAYYSVPPPVGLTAATLVGPTSPAPVPAPDASISKTATKSNGLSTSSHNMGLFKQSTLPVSKKVEFDKENQDRDNCKPSPPSKR